jgi:hypothetical protein
MQREIAASGTIAADNPVEARLAGSYNELLLADERLAHTTRRTLAERQQARGITMPGRLLCHVLRPRFLGAQRVTELNRVAGVLAALFERAGSLLLSSDRLQDRIGATEQERAIWSVDPGYPGFTVTSRLDSFMVGNLPRFVEYNAESPASIGYCDVLSELFAELEVMRRWSDGRTVRRFHARQELLEMLLWAYHEWGGTVRPTIAIIDWADVLTKRDFELCAEYFVSQGLPTVITDPRSFEYRGGKLWLGDDHIPLVYRRVLLHELLERADEAAPLLQAYQDGAVCMVNSPRSKLLHKKSAFALVQDGTLDLNMSREEASVVESTMPWTRLVEEGMTDYAGQNVDLLDLVVEKRERLVLKPVDDYGGRGVVLGWETGSEDWERAIEQAVREPSVVQERVPVPQGDFPVVEDDHFDVVPLLVDTDPLLFRGRTGGILTRISGSALLNVSAGTGSTAPTFVIEGEED